MSPLFITELLVYLLLVMFLKYEVVKKKRCAAVNSRDSAVLS